MSTNTSSLLTTESRKRKAETLESSLASRPLTQEIFKKSTAVTTTTTTTATATAAKTTTASATDDHERVYNAENIPPIASASVHLNVDLHCHIPAPKRPRIDPFSSISAQLEKISDDDFNVGIKSIKVS